MDKKKELTRILHNPYGWNHPYEPGQDERIPRDPVAGQAVVLQAVSQPGGNFDRMSVEWQREGETRPHSLEGECIEQGEDRCYWRFEMPAFSYASRVSYRFNGYRNGMITHSETYEFNVAGWFQADSFLGCQSNENEVVLYWRVDYPGLSLQEKIRVDQDGRLWLEWALQSGGLGADPIMRLSEGKAVDITWTAGSWRVSLDAEDPSLLRFSSVDGAFSITQKGAPELLLDGDGRLKQILCRYESPGDEAFYGFGERFNALDQRGQAVDICVYNQYTNQGMRTYIPMPFFLSSHGYGFYLDTSRRVWYDMAGEQQDAWSFRTGLGEGQQLRACVIAKSNPWEIVSDFQGLTGKPALPPVWAFGPWMSSNDWNSQETVQDQVSLTQEHDIPATVLVIEAWSDESTFYRWNDALHPLKNPGEAFHLEDFTFPPEGRWPNPKGMIDALHEAGIRVVLWQIPVLKKLLEADQVLGRQPQHEADEAYMIEQGYCVHQADGEPYRVPPAWFRQSLVMDFTNLAAVDWWMGKRAYLLEEMGVDGFKTDGGEHIWRDDLKFHNGKTSDELWNLYPLLYQQAFNGLVRKYRGEDGVLFSRAGFTGAQAYPCHWAGDQGSTWGAFQSSILAGLNLGICGVPFWGWDIAGFHGDVPEPDLYLRATAMAVFCPIMQYHSDYNGRRVPSLDRTPWNFQERSGDLEVIPTYRRFANLRMNLLPYIVSEAHAACRSGLPMMRALPLEYPHDPACAAFPYQYLFGSSLLVAPVTTPQADRFEVYLPQGSWIDFWDDETLRGPKTLLMDVSRDRIPVFIRAGSILPLNLGDTFDLPSPVGNAVDRYQNLCFRVYPYAGPSYLWQDYAQDTTHEIGCKLSNDEKTTTIRLPSLPYPVHLILLADGVQKITVDENQVPRVAHPELLVSDQDCWFINMGKNQAILRVQPGRESRIIHIFRG
jgi:alpha-D-xyloside xylohydrolase